MGSRLTKYNYWVSPTPMNPGSIGRVIANDRSLGSFVEACKTAQEQANGVFFGDFILTVADFFPDSSDEKGRWDALDKLLENNMKWTEVPLPEDVSTAKENGAEKHVQPSTSYYCRIAS